jgi:hypothetical protein
MRNNNNNTTKIVPIQSNKFNIDLFLKEYRLSFLGLSGMFVLHHCKI